MSNNSTSNFKIALGGTIFPTPLFPYASSGGQIIFARYPFISFLKVISQH
jgi:hypothetical protein